MMMSAIAMIAMAIIFKTASPKGVVALVQTVSGLLGGLYEKQRNIWGVAIIHYILGQAACCLGFLS